MSRLRAPLFWLVAAALVVCHGIVAWNSLVVNRLWEDEAFNLTVPLNLLHGLGYASDGTLSGSTITPFDARISTGPAVLLPVTAVLALGVDPVLGGRFVALAFWALLLAGLAVLGARIGGRWAALIALTVPLAFDTTQGISPIQGPADLLGEIPAAALLVWALVVLPRRAWLAGLLVGLTIQAKLIALLALPAFAVALWMLAPGTGWTRLGAALRRCWLPLVMVGVPTLLVELWALLALGGTGFVEHLRALRSFMLSGGQGGLPTTVAEKLQTLAGSWFVWTWLAALAAAAVVALVVAGAIVTRRADAGERAGVVGGYAVVASAVGLVAFVGWWATASHLPLWVRHPSPGVFAFAPVLVAAAIAGGAALWRRGTLARITSSVALTALCGILAAGSVLHVVHALTPRPESLESQRAVAAPLRAWVEETGTDWLAADPWGSAIPSILLIGTHMGLADAPSMAEVPRLTGGECAAETLIDVGYLRICSPPEEAR